MTLIIEGRSNYLFNFIVDYLKRVSTPEIKKMDKETLKQAIDGKLEVIREQFDLLKQHNGRIPSIELDLIMSNIREVYEYFLHLDKENLPPIPFRLDNKKEKPVAVPPGNGEEVSPPVVQEEDSVPAMEIEMEMEEQHVAQRTEAAEEKRRTADLFSEQVSTLADKFKEKSEPRIADKLQHNSLTDIRKGIGINEKFRFINELFDGSLRIYEDSIQKLNECSTSEDADTAINDLKSAFDWSPDSEAATMFIEIIRRRF